MFCLFTLFKFITKTIASVMCLIFFFCNLFKILIMKTVITINKLLYIHLFLEKIKILNSYLDICLNIFTSILNA
jgi:hypothetical protein